MDERTVRGLQFLSLQVVGAVAVIHFVVATEQLVRFAANGLLGAYLSGMVLAHPRALLFAVSSVAIGAGVVATARGVLPRRRAYQLGIAVLVTYLVGWVAWHTVLDHGVALSGGPTTEGDAHTHGGLLGTLYSHYVEPIWAVVTVSGSTPGTGRTMLGVVSKSLELLGVALLAVLLRVDPAARAEPGAGWPGLENPETE